MAEKQITVGRTTYKLPELFLVMATQNPLEQEGTYPLPEAQLDRFLLHLKVDYPDAETEREILRLTRNEALNTAQDQPAAISQADIFSARQAILKLHLAESLEEYIVQLIMATRNGAAYSPKLASWVSYGASPRATIALERCARAKAWLADRDFVTPDDVQAVFHNALRHRLILTYTAEAEGVTTDDVLTEILNCVPVP